MYILEAHGSEVAYIYPPLHDKSQHKTKLNHKTQMDNSQKLIK